ncbi:unnamed protein product [Cochlearia groenlandica]
MESSLVLLLLLITFAIIHVVEAQDQQGFISLDCGLPADEPSPYKETYTGLSFTSDETFIKSGKSGRIQTNEAVNLQRPYETVRYFPDGIRNCYDLSVQKGIKYLIRACFIYGNYDGRQIYPVFDLYLGANLWATMDSKRWATSGVLKEILHITTSNSLQICLVKTDDTTPLISSLELRPMNIDSYNTKTGSLNLDFRYYLNESGFQLRYSSDVYDRIWQTFFDTRWTHVSTTLNVDNANKYVIPQDALKNAATPTNASAPLTIEWSSRNPDTQYYLYFHLLEIQDLHANETREFNILFNGNNYYSRVTPDKLSVSTYFRSNPRTCQGGECSIQLVRTENSTLPPLLNAFEVYKVIQFPQSETDENDVDAIESIEATYALSRINWQGDPCVPRHFTWDGLNCSNTNISMPPRITSLNLSSSGLTGTIATAIQNLTQLETLDLSNNNLTGGVPEFLGNMKMLSVINLNNNNLNGSIPQALQNKGLKLSVEGNPNLCLLDSCRKSLKKKVIVPIVASAASAIIIVIVALVLFITLKKKKTSYLQGLLHFLLCTSTKSVTFVNKKGKKFKYSEVIKMTNNFKSELGKGGFGKVYRGTVNSDEQVAVKVLSQSSAQGYKEFKTEVDLLLRVHHTNLVSLAGYCYEGDHLALIYEFMPNGDLKQHLSGGRSFINWSIRLRIALEAAQGLEYLHIGCTPPMVHRDVKTDNILLDENLKAKLADFGLSRSFQNGDKSVDPTVVAGTLGYLDPEYHRTSRLSSKSDVYSFGIVLLEMITNQPVINQTNGNTHITQWVDLKLDGGDLLEIMDPNLGGFYDINSAWRAIELAMSCSNPSSWKRPSMSRVINELKECIVCENSGLSKNGDLECQESISSDTSMVPRAR